MRYDGSSRDRLPLRAGFVTGLPSDRQADAHQVTVWDKQMLAPIEDDAPATWQDLENHVAQILREAGLRVEQKKPLATARGTVEIDVFAEDESIKPTITTLVECKYWKRPVPQTVVHAFRTVVTDSGANVGLIVSLSGFQAGAENAAALSNIHLVDWYIFQSLFVERWYRNYMSKQASDSLDPLHEYTEPINSRIFRKADALPEPQQAEFARLRKKYSPVPSVLTIIFMSANYTLPGLIPGFQQGPPPLPLRRAFTNLDPDLLKKIPEPILDAMSLRGLLDAVIKYSTAATSEFDEIFGERA
jgi:restriction system protein